MKEKKVFVKRCRFMAALTIVTSAILPFSALAQPSASAYPTKPVRVIVGLAPGGATDIQARWYSQKLTESLGQHFVVDNRPGAGGLIAYQLIANAPPDGYTLLAATPSLPIVPALQEKPSFDPVKDFAPVSLVTKAPYLVVATPSFSPKSMKESIAFAKAKPNELLFGAAGRTSVHLGGAWLAHATNTKITIVTYKGSGPVLTDLMAGQVHVSFANVLGALPLLKSGRLRVLAVTTPQRSSALPDLPTVAESGVPGFDVSTWHGWLATKGTPASVIRRLNEALAAAVRKPDITQRLAEDGAVGIASSPEKFKQHIAEEVTRWKRLVKETGLSMD